MEIRNIIYLFLVVLSLIPMIGYHPNDLVIYQLLQVMIPYEGNKRLNLSLQIGGAGGQLKPAVYVHLLRCVWDGQSR